MVDGLLRLAGVERVDDAAVGGPQVQGVVGRQVGVADSEHPDMMRSLKEHI